MVIYYDMRCMEVWTDQTHENNKNIQKFKKEWFEYFDANMSDLAQRLNDGAALSDEDKKALKENLETFKSSLFN